MARCYHCNKVLSDEWLRKIGARLMGKKGGVSKRRTTSGRPAANARWNKKKESIEIDKST